MNSTPDNPLKNLWGEPSPADIARREQHEREQISFNTRLGNLKAVVAKADASPHVAGPLAVPPGVAGEIAQFIYGAAPRPVPEVAIAATLGLLAGVCGKAFNISSPPTGMNLYILLVAVSATGKEALHTGPNLIMKAVLVNETHLAMTEAQKFVTYDNFVSGPALIAATSDNPCMVSIAGEWGKKIKEMADAGNRSQSPMYTLRSALTNLFEKSGSMSVAGGNVYRKREDHVKSVEGVALSILGESTPGTFYNCLTEEMMEDGMMSRLLVIENADEHRPARNRAPVLVPSAPLLQKIKAILYFAVTNLKTPRMVLPDEEAARMLDNFDVECDNAIDAAGKNEASRQMWNRAYMKVFKIAGLLAIADAPAAPVILPPHVEWALMLVRRNIALFKSRLDKGEIGTGDSAIEAKLKEVIAKYLATPTQNPLYEEMRKTAIVPRSFIQARLARFTALTEHRNGANRALDDSLRNLESIGFLAEVERSACEKKFNTKAKCYRIEGGLE